MLTAGETDLIADGTEFRRLLKEKIMSGELPLKINPEKQKKHVLPIGADMMPDGRSYLTIDADTAQETVNRYAATGDVKYFPSSHKFVELVITDIVLGVDGYSGKATNEAFIIYSRTGTHIVPTKKGRDEDD